MSLMAGHWCPIIHRFNLKTCVNVKNGQLKAIKAVLRLSRCIVHTLMINVGFLLFLITYNHKTIKQGGSNLFGTPVSRHKAQIPVEVRVVRKTTQNRWTGWVWEITGWRSRLHGKYHGGFWTSSIKILVSPSPTDYILWSFDFSSLN